MQSKFNVLIFVNNHSHFVEELSSEETKMKMKIGRSKVIVRNTNLRKNCNCMFVHFKLVSVMKLHVTVRTSV